MPSDNEFVACVDRKKSYGTPLLHMMDVEGKRTFNSHYIRDEEGRLLRDIGLIRERWVRWFHKLLNTKSPTLDPTATDELKVWSPVQSAGRRPV